MTAHTVARLRMASLVLLAVLLQSALAADLRIAGVAPDLVVLLVICAGLIGGAEAGAWVGFGAGLMTDMFLSSTPVGLSALTYCLVGAAVGAVRASTLQGHRALFPLAGLVATAAAVIAFVAFGDVLGQHQLLAGGRSWLVRVTVIESLWNALLALPAGYLWSAVARGSVGVETLGGGEGLARGPAR